MSSSLTKDTGPGLLCKAQRGRFVDEGEGVGSDRLDTKMSEPGGPTSGMPPRKIFELLGTSVAKGCAARLGRLSVPGRRPIETPNYTAVTSRGALPHLTPDNVKNHTYVESAYMALEDC